MGQLCSADRKQWFRQAKFGMFVHFGLYAIPGRGEWLMRNELIPREEYAKLAEKFLPKRSAPGAWARLAKKAGMKYMVFTSRHHDGFCLFDSQASNFTSVQSPVGVDFVAEYVAACRREGLGVGIYYSLGDWRFGFPQASGLTGTPEQGRQMREQAHKQIRELMTNYGKIDVLWYDGGWVYPSRPKDGTKEQVKFWQAEKLNKMVRKLQPRILINNRSGMPCDFGTPEQHIEPEAGRLWECCMTVGSERGWGYLKYDPEIKTAGQLISSLVYSASQGGNFLLNIGPRPDGSVTAATEKLLEAMGNWLKINGESIYGAEPLDIFCRTIGIASRANGHGYFHAIRWPGKEFTLTNVKTKIKSATILKTGRRLDCEHKNNFRVTLKGLPASPPDPYDSVIKLEFGKKQGDIYATFNVDKLSV